jgi:hypothetical protein
MNAEYEKRSHCSVANRVSQQNRFSVVSSEGKTEGRKEFFEQKASNCLIVHKSRSLSLLEAFRPTVVC